MRNFIQKFILLIQGKLPNYTEYLIQTNEYRKKISEYQTELNVLRLEKAIGVKKNTVLVAGFDDLTTEPTDEKERKIYAARVDEFYEDILKKKVRVSVAEIREILSAIGYLQNIPNNMKRDQYDFFLRGMEAFAWKIHEWATILQGDARSGDINKSN